MPGFSMVLPIVEVGPSLVSFEGDEDLADAGFDQEQTFPVVMLSRVQWAALGEPEELTVTIAPGDTLTVPAVARVEARPISSMDLDDVDHG